MYTATRSVLLCLTILLMACSDTGNEPDPQSSESGSITVTPSSGRPGDPVRVIGSSPFNASVRVSFNGIPCAPESLRGELISVRVPWGATTGPVAVIAPGSTITGPVFAVNTPCAGPMCLVPFSGKPVTRSSSLHYDLFYPHVDSIPWTATFSADTLTLTQEYTVGDDSRWTMSIRFRFASLVSSPLSAQGILVRREIDGIFTEVLKGQVAIQDWNNGGVVSGRMSFVRTAPDGWYDRDFWVALSTQ
jgi:hypothetical protein